MAITGKSLEEQAEERKILPDPVVGSGSDQFVAAEKAVEPTISFEVEDVSRNNSRRR